MMTQMRSFLFVPATEKKLSKIESFDADAYIIDLEDSIGKEYKTDSLQLVIDYLEKSSLTNLFVRVNKDRYRCELEALDRFNIGIMLPKMESDADYSDAAEILKCRNVIALIESPMAFLNVNAIVAIPWIDALAFGAEDFTVATNTLNTLENLSVPKWMLSLAAKAYGKKVYDTPCFKIGDEAILEAEVQQAIALGYDGKLAIHPKQIPAINQAFGCSDLNYMKHIVSTYEKTGKTVCEIDGVVYEKFHIDRFRRILSAMNDKA